MNSNGKTPQFTALSSAQQMNQAFEHLQATLKALQQAIRLRPEHTHTYVIIPSFRIYSQHPWAECQAHEERLLFFLGLLRQAHTRIIYITSTPISDAVKAYNLTIMAPGYQAEQKRLFFIALHDKCATLSLTEKLLAHSKYLTIIKKLIVNTKQCHIIPYQMTAHEQSLALKLNIPIYGCHPKLLTFASKSNSRKLFKTLSLPPPFGYEGIQDKTELIAAIQKMCIEQPHTKKIIIKWNHGVSGQGNALIDLTSLTVSEKGVATKALTDRVNQAKLVNRALKADAYFVKLSEYGGIVERYITDWHTSPSVQLQILPDKTVQLLSTTEQIMGGIAAQHFKGCKFPADERSNQLIIPKALTIAKYLAANHVIGFLAIDFIVSYQDQTINNCYPLEINLRLGGAVNPLLMLHLLTNGQYDAERNTFITQGGNTKCFIEHDDLFLLTQQPMTPQQLYDIIQSHNLQYSETKQTGIIIHMASALATCYKFGLIAIGNSHNQAEKIAQKAVSIIRHQ